MCLADDLSRVLRVVDEKAKPRIVWPQVQVMLRQDRTKTVLPTGRHAFGPGSRITRSDEGVDGIQCAESEEAWPKLATASPEPVLSISSGTWRAQEWDSTICAWVSVAASAATAESVAEPEGGSVDTANQAAEERAAGERVVRSAW